MAAWGAGRRTVQSEAAGQRPMPLGWRWSRRPFRPPPGAASPQRRTSAFTHHLSVGGPPPSSSQLLLLASQLNFRSLPVSSLQDDFLLLVEARDQLGLHAVTDAELDG